MALRVQYASNLMLHMTRVAVSPVHPAGDVLILAGRTGPLTNIRVQNFYRWCSKHFRETYTMLDPGEHRVLGSILPNVHVLNADYHFLPTGHRVSGGIPAEIHVSDKVPTKASEFQIHSKGSFSIFFEDGVHHVANDLQSKNFHPAKYFTLDDNHIQRLQ